MPGPENEVENRRSRSKEKDQDAWTRELGRKKSIRMPRSGTGEKKKDQDA